MDAGPASEDKAVSMEMPTGIACPPHCQRAARKRMMMMMTMMVEEGEDDGGDDSDDDEG